VLFGNQIRERRVSIFVDYVGSIIILAASHMQVTANALRHDVALIPSEGHMLALYEVTGMTGFPVMLRPACDAGDLTIVVSVLHTDEPGEHAVQLIH
jgi:hypothetical protein